MAVASTEFFNIDIVVADTHSRFAEHRFFACQPIDPPAKRRPLSAQNRFSLASEMKQNGLRKDLLLFLFSCRSCLELLDPAVNCDLFLANMYPFDISDREMK